MPPDSVGTLLRNTRTERNLTLEQVARSLHIRAEYLQALENNQPKNLPSPVQVRGFLRMYADHLGLPVQAVLDDWDGIASALPILAEPETTVEQAPALPLQPAPQAPPEAAPPLAQAPVSEPVPEVPGEMVGSAALREPSAAGSAFIEIGKRLKQQRQLLNLSLPEIERYIHVRQHYLDALEKGQIGDLPSPVQGRGMLSNYAHFLNLDVDGLLLLFAEGLQSRREERIPAAQRSKKEAAPATEVKSPPRPAARRLISRDLWVSLLLIFIILGFALWTAAQVDALNVNRATTGTPPSIADVLLSNSTATLPATVPATIPANLSTLAPGEVGARPGGNSTPLVQASLAVNRDFPLQVVVVALQRAFLRISVDGKITFDGRIVPGNVYPFTAKERIELLTGSAAAIHVYFNQEDLGVLGQVGQVRAFLFTREGAVTPTPLFTPTRTSTIEPTSTIQPSPTAPKATITPFVP